MKVNFLKILAAISTIFISGLFGAWIKSIQDGASHRMRYLDFKYEFHNVLGDPSTSNKNIEVFSRDRKIDDLTQVTIYLYNATDRDYADLPIYIEVFSTAGDTLALLDAQVTGTESSLNFIRPIVDSIPPRYKGSLTFGYNLKALNRIGNEAGFVANFLVIGKPDKFQINVVKEGLTVRDYEYEHFESFWESMTFVYIVGISLMVMVIIMVVIGLRYLTKQELKSYKRFEKIVADKLETKAVDGKVNLTASEIAQEVTKLEQQYDWDTQWGFARWVEGRKRPDPEE